VADSLRRQAWAGISPRDLRRPPRWSNWTVLRKTGERRFDTGAWTGVAFDINTARRAGLAVREGTGNQTEVVRGPRLGPLASRISLSVDDGVCGMLRRWES